MTSEKQFSHFMDYLEEKALLDYFLNLYERFTSSKLQAEKERSEIEEQEKRHTAIDRYGLEYDYRSIQYGNGIHPYDTFEKYLASEREVLQETEAETANRESEVLAIWNEYCASCYHTNPDEKFEVEAEIVLQLVEADFAEEEKSTEPVSAFYDYAKRTGSWEEIRILISEINDLKDILLSLEKLLEDVKSQTSQEPWQNEKYEDGTPYYNSFEEYLADIENHILAMKNGIEQKRKILLSKFWEPFMAEIAGLSIDDECEKLRGFLYR